MALRNIRIKGDDVLRKKAKNVDNINERIYTILDDMAETMYASNGIGLAAPQIGILKRLVVIDFGEGLIELINPVILKESGEQIVPEGCLSIPNVWGEVKRPGKIEVEALNRNGEKYKIKGTEILARVLSHEIDHLEGILFEDKVIRYINNEEEEE